MMKKLFVLLSVIMFAVTFAVSAGADEWDFYGSVRFQTFNTNADENNPFYGNATGFDDRDSTWGLNTVSRIGATVQNGDIGGRFEYGHTDAGNAVTLRRLYGTWNFGMGELLVGRDYTPIHFVTGKVYENDGGLRRFGGFFTFRPMIQVKIDDFKLALISPSNGSPDNMGSLENDNTYPKVEASYTLAMDTLSVRLFGGWNGYEAASATDKLYNINSYIYGVAGTVNAGPIKLKVMVWDGQNVGLYGLTTNHDVDSNADWDATSASVRNNESYGGIASVGVKINDVVGVEAGFGYVSAKDDLVGDEDNDEAWAAYLQAPITLAPAVTVVPEIGHYDYETNGTVGNDADQGYETYFGAKWQINF